MDSHQLGPLPQVHPRHDQFTAAKNELAMILANWKERHDLSSAEYTAALAEEVRDFAYRLVWIERRSGSE